VQHKHSTYFTIPEFTTWTTLNPQIVDFFYYFFQRYAEIATALTLPSSLSNNRLYSPACAVPSALQSLHMATPMKIYGKTEILNDEYTRIVFVSSS
jgi:hypothetical protein